MENSEMGRRPAVFLDRDGTLNVEVNYLHRIDDLVLIPGVPQAIKQLNEAGYIVVVVTNQAGIARGYYDEGALRALQAHLITVLRGQEAHLDGWYFCPHHPEFSGACHCRKPQPGMLLQAAADHNIDLANSWLVGDTVSDIGAGQAVGCRTVLVRTGYGRQTELQLDASGALPDAVADNLTAAVRIILDFDQAVMRQTDEGHLERRPSHL